MIRFECQTCGRSLRAPEEMAGRRGKCARCGAVNQVPAAPAVTALAFASSGLSVAGTDEDSGPLSVEVKRAPGASPFRSTADVEMAAAPALIAITSGEPGLAGALTLASPPAVVGAMAAFGEARPTETRSDEIRGAESLAEEVERARGILDELRPKPNPASVNEPIAPAPESIPQASESVNSPATSGDELPPPPAGTDFPKPTEAESTKSAVHDPAPVIDAPAEKSEKLIDATPFEAIAAPIPATARPAGDIPLAPSNNRLMAIVTALVVGVVVGFVLGLAAARWGGW